MHSKSAPPESKKKNVATATAAGSSSSATAASSSSTGPSAVEPTGDEGAPEAMDTSAGCDDEMVNAFLAGIMIDDPEEQHIMDSVWLLLSFS